MKALKCFLVTVFFALLVNSCNNPFNVLNTSEAGRLPAGKGSLYLKIAGNERTIMPSALANEDFIYELIVTSIPDGKKETIKPAALETPVILDVGVYNLVVNVYDANSQLLFSGTANNIEITEGENSAAVNLQPVIGGGTGTFSWNITLPDSVLSAVMEIAPKGGGTPVGSITLNDEKTGKRELPSGFYDVTIYMTGNNPDYGTITVTRKEILHVYNGRVSEYKNDFADINFEIIYEVKFFNAAAGEYIPAYVIHGDTIPDNFFDDEFLTIKGYAPPSDAFLYSGNVPSELGYTFGGWYLNNDFTEKWADDTPVTKNITIYPKWNSAENLIDVSGFANIVNFINDITPTTNTSYTLFIAEDVTLTETLTINSGVTLTVTSAGITASTINRGFEGAANSGLFIVGDGAYLTFENVTIDGQKDAPEFSANAASLVRVNGGTLTMKDGAVLRNNRAEDYGGGVYVNDGGTFTMEDGIISGNTATIRGGGVYVVGGGTFTMNGGTIGGTGSGSSNTAESGGGVCVVSTSSIAEFTMTDGIISGNTADFGGGVYVRSSDGIFTMEGGTISDNTANGKGGGVCMGPDGIFIMEGGTISGNTVVGENGGGVFVSSGEWLKLGGTAVIKDNKKGSDENNNVYLESGKFITLSTTPLQSPAEIWVQTDDNSGVIVYSGAESGDAQYFHADDEANSFIIFDNGKLVLKTATPGLAFELITTGTNANTYRVRKGTVTSGEVVIPATHLDTDQHANELPVTEIGSASDASSGAFYQSNINTNITTVYIPATVTLIGGSAFRSCFQLTSITIPASVTTIGARALFNCTKLTTVTFASNSQLATIGQEAFSSSSITDIEIPASVTNIDESAFSICTDLETVTFADGSRLTTIGNGAFSNCENLTNITIPAGVTSIGNEAFYGCSLPSIEIPASVTNIDDGAFSDCTDLETVTFVPSSQLQNIGDRAFLNCESLTSINIPASVTEIGRIAFRNCTGLETVTFAANSWIQSIGSSAFHGCTSLKTVTFAADSPLETIGSSVFSECESLTSISIPASVTSIEDSAFYYCIALTSITIPASVTSIGEGAFSDWKNTQTIYIEGHASEVEADAAWPNWKSQCSAKREYLQSDSTWRDQDGNSATGP